ncbi:MAG TPA: prepilin-type N-terminal cleavage/methylation domain-containing protein [Vicinamibacteria bacterium]|nr:prepilin-type N-terminal cleavage/methylation domain-containing protein [Vicinamibacteria bacterium]
MKNNSMWGHRGGARASAQGFTLVEVLVSILVTLAVMAAVFGLLTRGQRSFQREPEVADLQQNARSALDMVSKDILQAGAGLPPEFPAFSRINGAGNQSPTDVLELIGTFQYAGNVFLGPEPVARLEGDDVVLVANTTNLNVDEMVVLYNDVPHDDRGGRTVQWAMARVTAVNEDATNPTFEARVTLDYGSFDPAYSNHLGGDGNAPIPVDFEPRPEFAQVSKITPVSVVRYSTRTDDPALYNGPPPQVLMRDVDFQNQPRPVGYLDDFEIAYVIGVAAPFEQDDPPNPVLDIAQGTPLTSENMLSSVRVTITARSVSSNMEGASQGPSPGIEDNFIRKTFSTNVNPRNVSAGLDTRSVTTP